MKQNPSIIRNGRRGTPAGFVPRKDMLVTDEEKRTFEWCSQWPKDWPSPSVAAKEIQQMAEDSGLLTTSPQKIISEIKDHNAVPGSSLEWLVGMAKEGVPGLGRRSLAEFVQ